MSSDTRVGQVAEVTGSRLRITLDSGVTSGVRIAHGHGYRVGQLGSFVRIPVGYVDAFAVVSESGAEVERSIDGGSVQRWLRAELVGEVPAGGRFERGISRHPTVGAPVHLANPEDLAVIYGGADDPGMVSIGSVAGAEAVPARLNANRLVARHSAVVGATGSGKSTTVVTLLRELANSSRFPSARVLILDLHGEYAAAFPDLAGVFRVEPDTGRSETALVAPYWALTLDELLPLTFGPLDDAGLAAVAARIVVMKAQALDRLPQPGVSAASVTVDTPIPFSIHQLWYDLFTEMQATHYERDGESQSRATWALDIDDTGHEMKGDALTVSPPRFKAIKDIKGDNEKIRLSKTSLNIGRPLERLAGRLRDSRYDFLFRPGAWTPAVDGRVDEDLDSWLRSLLGSDRPITVLDLSGIPGSVLTHLVAALMRAIYDALFWARNLSEGGRERPLLLVLEEAHQYLADSAGVAIGSITRIAREGRKYGVGLMLVSQRPSDVDATVLSQCGTLITLRLTNSRDRSQVAAAVTDELGGILAGLPSLRTGEAIVTGEAVALPLRAIVTAPTLGDRPQSGDAVVYDQRGPGGWNRPREPQDYAAVVKAWRGQAPRAAPTVPSSVETGKSGSEDGAARRSV